jgi:SPP1 gp7 family putative phage head morphogenesis protein
MLAAASTVFENIAIEVMEHLDRRKIKTLEIKDYQQTLDEVLLTRRIESTVERGLRGNITEVMSEGAEGTRQTLGFGFGITNEERVKFAKKYTSKLSGSIAESSVKTVRETIAKGIAEGKDLRKVRAELMEKVDGWSEARAETVARTETLRAANQGSLIVMEKAGIEYKQWLAAPDACSMCLELANQINDMSYEYDSKGDKYGLTTTPPVHPRCRCTIAGLPSEAVNVDENGNYTLAEGVPGTNPPVKEPMRLSKELDSLTAGEIETTFASLTTKYPKINITKVDDVTNLGKTTYAETWSFGEGKGTELKRATNISFNRSIFKKPNADVSAKLQKEFVDDWSVVRDVKGVTTHEFGHSVDDYLQGEGIDTMLPTGSASIYATRSQAEDFAETFVLHERGMLDDTRPWLAGKEGELVGDKIKVLHEMLRLGGLL